MPASNKAWLTAISKLSPDGIIATDSRFDIAFISPSALRLLRVAEDLAVGKPLSLFLDSAYFACEGIFDQLSKGQSVEDVALPLVFDQQCHDFRVSGVPIVDRNRCLGAVIKLAPTLAPKTEMVSPSLLVTQKIAALGVAASNILKELSNPLTAILANAGYVKETLQSFLEKTAQTQVAAQQINDVVAAAEDIAFSVGNIGTVIDKARVARALIDLLPSSRRLSNGEPLQIRVRLKSNPPNSSIEISNVDDTHGAVTLRRLFESFGNHQPSDGFAESVWREFVAAIGGSLQVIHPNQDVTEFLILIPFVNRQEDR